MLLCITPSVARAQDRNAVPTSPDSGLVRIPLVDQQDLRFKRLSTVDGLSQTMVTSILQDDQGFMWFGTQYGLNRYDGYKFKVFKHDPGLPDSLSGVLIQALFKDRSGKIWISNDQVVDRFDPATETFTHYRVRSHKSTGPWANVLHISEDHTGMIWLASPSDGLRRLDPASGRITEYRHDPLNPASLSSNTIWSSGEDKRGAFWVTTREGLDKFDRDSGKVTLHVPLPDPSSLRFHEDSKGVFWLTYTTGSGLAVFDRETNRLTRYSFHEQEPANTSRTGVATMIEDRAGNLWLGTASEGVLKFDQERRRLTRYRNHAWRSR